MATGKERNLFSPLGMPGLVFQGPKGKDIVEIKIHDFSQGLFQKGKNISDLFRQLMEDLQLFSPYLLLCQHYPVIQVNQFKGFNESRPSTAALT